MYTKTELAWKRLSGLYGYPFVSQYGTEPTAEWELALGNLDVDQIRRGIERCTTEPEFCKFPPNPMEFLDLCQPTREELGLPGDDEALRQAAGCSTERHAAVVYTLQQMGTGNVHKLRRLDTKSAERLFAKYWTETVNLVARGEEIPEPAKQIEEIKPTPAAREDAISALAKIREETGL